MRQSERGSREDVRRYLYTDRVPRPSAMVCRETGEAGLAETEKDQIRECGKDEIGDAAIDGLKILKGGMRIRGNC